MMQKPHGPVVMPVAADDGREAWQEALYLMYIGNALGQRARQREENPADSARQTATEKA